MGVQLYTYCGGKEEDGSILGKETTRNELQNHRRQGEVRTMTKWNKAVFILPILWTSSG